MVLYGSHEGVQVLRFVGRIDCGVAPAVHQFVDGLFLGAPLTGFVIDLTETDNIDSTNLGLLARIANRMQERGGPRVTIVSHRQDINEILLTMGFDEVFDLVEAAPGAGKDTRPLTTLAPDRYSLGRTMLEAHRTLMALNDRNRDQFADVVSLLEGQESNHRHQPI
jgi:anti-anti-sigma factor